MTPQQRAERSAQVMWADDLAAQHLGISVVEVRVGYARSTMRVRQHLTNGHGLCHGGYIFMLADTAFAYACNTRNQRTVAAAAAIEFVRAAHRDDVLSAEAIEQHHGPRAGVYDVRVTDQHGHTIALFRGKSATIKGHFFEEIP